MGPVTAIDITAAEAHGSDPQTAAGDRTDLGRGSVVGVGRAPPGSPCSRGRADPPAAMNSPGKQRAKRGLPRSLMDHQWCWRDGPPALDLRPRYRVPGGPPAAQRSPLWVPQSRTAETGCSTSWHLIWRRRPMNSATARSSARTSSRMTVGRGEGGAPSTTLAVRRSVGLWSRPRLASSADASRTPAPSVLT